MDCWLFRCRSQLTSNAARLCGKPASLASTLALVRPSGDSQIGSHPSDPMNIHHLKLFHDAARRGSNQWSGPPSSFRDRAARKSFWAGRDRSDSLDLIETYAAHGLASAVGHGSENWHFTARA